jgi:hypothetical protein
MKKLLFTFFALCSLNALHAQIKATLTLKEASCKEAECECHKCLLIFSDDQGNVLEFNQLKTEKLPEILIEQDGKTVINSTMIGKRFAVEYKVGVCVCVVNKNNESFMEETASKVIVSIVPEQK